MVEEIKIVDLNSSIFHDMYSQLRYELSNDNSYSLGSTLKSLIKDSIEEAAGEIDTEVLFNVDVESINTIISDKLQDEIAKIDFTVPIKFDTEGFKLALREVIAEQFQPALANDSNEVWNHDIAVTQKPPDENILDIAGKQGYQLVNVIYDSEQNVWMSYFKKRINV